MLYFNSTNAATAVVKQEVMWQTQTLNNVSVLSNVSRILTGSEAQIEGILHPERLKATLTVIPAGWGNILGDRRDHGSDHISSRDFNSRPDHQRDCGTKGPGWHGRVQLCGLQHIWYHCGVSQTRTHTFHCPGFTEILHTDDALTDSRPVSGRLLPNTIVL